MTHHPRKRFGQNFLVDEAIINGIVAAIDPQPRQSIVEIGPGQGAITAALIASGAYIDAVEIDRDLAQYLEEKFSSYQNFHLHCGDILKFSLSSVLKQNNPLKLRIVGNLPYNISTPLLFKLFAEIDIIEDMYFMLQREVALRLTAAPDTKEYGRMSIMAQYYCDMINVLDVAPSSFSPAPKVQSCVVKFIPYTEPQIQVSDHTLLQNIVTHAFTQRRKTIANSLKSYISQDELIQLQLDPKLRAENLTLLDYANITNYLAQD